MARRRSVIVLFIHRLFVGSFHNSICWRTVAKPDMRFAGFRKIG